MFTDLSTENFLNLATPTPTIFFFFFFFADTKSWGCGLYTGVYGNQMTHRFRRSVGIVYTRYLWIVWTHEAQPSGFRTKFRGTACTQFLPTYEINLCVICFIEWAQKFGKKINSVFFQFYRMHGKIMRPVITGRMVMKKIMRPVITGRMIFF